MGRGGYTVESFVNNLTVNADGGVYADAIIPLIETKCDKPTGQYGNLSQCYAALHGAQPVYIFIVIGVNDVGYDPPYVTPPVGQTVWQNRYISVLDTLHAQWPDAQIYLTAPYKRQGAADDSVFTTLKAWIANVIAARPAFAHAGDDETVWLKNDLATYSGDGIHLNAAGQIEAANQRYALLP